MRLVFFVKADEAASLGQATLILSRTKLLATLLRRRLREPGQQ